MDLRATRSLNTADGLTIFPAGRNVRHCAYAAGGVDNIIDMLRLKMYFYRILYDASRCAIEATCRRGLLDFRKFE